MVSECTGIQSKDENGVIESQSQMYSCLVFRRFVHFEIRQLKLYLCVASEQWMHSRSQINAKYKRTDRANKN